MGGLFDLDSKEKRISLLESKLNESGIWNNLKEASKINGELINLKKECSDAKKLKSSLEGLEELISLSDDLEKIDSSRARESERQFYFVPNRRSNPHRYAHTPV